jgi:hypothetical protein
VATDRPRGPGAALGLAIVAAGSFGCRLDFEARELDAGHPALPDADAPCTSWGTFALPQPLPGPIGAGTIDWFPTPSADERTLWFYSLRSGNADLYVATRASAADPFSAAAPIAELSTSAYESGPTVTGDQLHLVFTRDGAPEHVLYESVRATVADPWGAPAALSALHVAGQNERDPFISADGLRLMFVRGASGSYQAFEATRTSIGDAFGSAAAHAELGAVQSPTLSADGLEILFASTRAPGAGGEDLWRARRPALDQQFGTPSHVDDFATAMDEFGERLSYDGATLYLNYAAKTSGATLAALYATTRTCLVR